MFGYRFTTQWVAGPNIILADFLLGHLFAGAAESRQTGWCDVIKSEHDAIRDYLETGGVFYIA